MTSLEQWRKWTFPSRGRFNDWQRFTHDAVARAPRAPGVYILAMPLKPGLLQTRPLGRLLARDPLGVLDIGEAQSLSVRLADLRECCANPGKRGHMAGWRLGKLRILERLRFEPSDLLVSWHTVKTKAAAYEWEGWMLRTYFHLFGELPPLNYKFNWSGFTQEELL